MHELPEISDASSDIRVITWLAGWRCSHLNTQAALLTGRETGHRESRLVVGTEQEARDGTD